MARKKNSGSKQPTSKKQPQQTVSLLKSPELKKKKTNNDPVDDKQHARTSCQQQQPLFSNDALMVIGSFSETIDIVKSMAHVCSDWNQALTSDGVFSELFKRDFGSVDWFVDKINYNLSVDLTTEFEIVSKKQKDDDSDEDDTDNDARSDKSTHSETNKQGPTPRPSADKMTLSEIREILENCYGKGKFWFTLYRMVIAFIPIQCPKLITDNEIVLPLLGKKKATTTKRKKKVTKKKKSKSNNEEEGEFVKDVVFERNGDDDDEDDDGDDSKSISKNYFYFSLGLGTLLDELEQLEPAARLIPALEYDLKTHKLGVILSLFDRHGLILEYFGQNSDHNECLNTITKEYKDHQKNILNYVYNESTREDIGALPRTPYIETLGSFLIGYDKNDNHACSILNFCYAIICGKECELFKGTRRDSVAMGTFDDDYDFGKAIGVGPHTEDAFMPYCSYEIIETPRYDEYSYGVSDVSIISNPKYAKFTSSFPGWIRGFWNANFYWYHVAELYSLLTTREDDDMLLVSHNQNKILHNLC